MEKFKRIGILGGMGPQATVLLQQRLIDAVKAEDDNGHIPLIIDMNPQVPSRLDFLLKGQGEDPGNCLSKMAMQLESSGAKALAMPCNTAHHFASEISNSVKIPLLHMVSLTAKIISDYFEGNNAVIGILASPATDDIKLFENAFKPYNLTTVFSKDRENMLNIIRRIKSVGVREEDIAALEKGAQNCKEQGAQYLLIGCSEYSLLKEKIKTDLPIIDTLDVLVDAVVNFSILEQENL